jgi:hypothetical protein
MRRALPLLVLALLPAAAPARAHVGSPNVFYDGEAGPYPVRIIVRPPAVIPGNAEVTVRLLEGPKADEVTVQPVLFKSGFKGAPAPDAAQPVPGAPGVWSGQLLLMKEGSWNIRVHVKGAAGEGTAQVPLPAVRNQLFEMDKRLGALLAGFGLFLFAGAVSIVGAAVREARLPPGEKPDGRRIFRARLAAALAALLFAYVIWGGKGWWDSAESQLRQTLFKPFDLRTTTRLAAGRPLLALTIENPHGSHQDWWPLIPDHGKLMHLFLLREPGLDAFAHLHPLAQEGQKDFLAALPPLPEGTYRVYADIVDENGLSQTLVDHVKIPAAWTAEAQEGAAAPAPDPDDSWRISDPLSRTAMAGPRVSRLENGGTMLFERQPLAANRETTLRFEVRGPDGSPARLDPYMGMLGHAVINRDDGEVFVHLHPMGTLNMAAQQIFAQTAGDAQPVMDPSSMAGMDHSSMPGMNHAASRGTVTGGVVSFPYEFPRPGRYRLWVQVKSGGQVLTGVFVAEVVKG